MSYTFPPGHCQPNTVANHGSFKMPSGHSSHPRPESYPTCPYPIPEHYQNCALDRFILHEDQQRMPVERCFLRPRAHVPPSFQQTFLNVPYPRGPVRYFHTSASNVHGLDVQAKVSLPRLGEVVPNLPRQVTHLLEPMVDVQPPLLQSLLQSPAFETTSASRGITYTPEYNMAVAMALINDHESTLKARRQMIPQDPSGHAPAKQLHSYAQNGANKPSHANKIVPPPMPPHMLLNNSRDISLAENSLLPAFTTSTACAPGRISPPPLPPGILLKNCHPDETSPQYSGKAPLPQRSCSRGLRYMESRDARAGGGAGGGTGGGQMHEQHPQPPVGEDLAANTVHLERVVTCRQQFTGSMTNKGTLWNESDICEEESVTVKMRQTLVKTPARQTLVKTPARQTRVKTPACDYGRSGNAPTFYEETRCVDEGMGFLYGSGCWETSEQGYDGTRCVPHRKDSKNGFQRNCFKRKVSNVRNSAEPYQKLLKMGTDLPVENHVHNAPKNLRGKLLLNELHRPVHEHADICSDVIQLSSKHEPTRECQRIAEVKYGDLVPLQYSLPVDAGERRTGQKVDPNRRGSLKNRNLDTPVNRNSGENLDRDALSKTSGIATQNQGDNHVTTAAGNAKGLGASDKLRQLSSLLQMIIKSRGACNPKTIHSGESCVLTGSLDSVESSEKLMTPSTTTSRCHKTPLVNVNNSTSSMEFPNVWSSDHKLATGVRRCRNREVSYKGWNTSQEHQILPRPVYPKRMSSAQLVNREPPTEQKTVDKSSSSYDLLDAPLRSSTNFNVNKAQLQSHISQQTEMNDIPECQQSPPSFGVSSFFMSLKQRLADKRKNVPVPHLPSGVLNSDVPRTLTQMQKDRSVASRKTLHGLNGQVRPVPVGSARKLESPESNSTGQASEQNENSDTSRSPKGTHFPTLGQNVGASKKGMQSTEHMQTHCMTTDEIDVEKSMGSTKTKRPLGERFGMFLRFSERQKSHESKTNQIPPLFGDSDIIPTQSYKSSVLKSMLSEGVRGLHRSRKSNSEFHIASKSGKPVNRKRSVTFDIDCNLQKFDRSYKNTKAVVKKRGRPKGSKNKTSTSASRDEQHTPTLHQQCSYVGKFQPGDDGCSPGVGSAGVNPVKRDRFNSSKSEQSQGKKRQKCSVKPCDDGLEAITKKKSVETIVKERGHLVNKKTKHVTSVVISSQNKNKIVEASFKKSHGCRSSSKTMTTVTSGVVSPTKTSKSVLMKAHGHCPVSKVKKSVKSVVTSLPNKKKSVENSVMKAHGHCPVSKVKKSMKSVVASPPKNNKKKSVERIVRKKLHPGCKEKTPLKSVVISPPNPCKSLEINVKKRLGCPGSKVKTSVMTTPNTNKSVESNVRKKLGRPPGRKDKKARNVKMSLPKQKISALHNNNFMQENKLTHLRVVVCKLNDKFYEKMGCHHDKLVKGGKYDKLSPEKCKTKTGRPIEGSEMDSSEANGSVTSPRASVSKSVVVLQNCQMDPIDSHGSDTNPVSDSENRTSNGSTCIDKTLVNTEFQKLPIAEDQSNEEDASVSSPSEIILPMDHEYHLDENRMCPMGRDEDKKKWCSVGREWCSDEVGMSVSAGKARREHFHSKDSERGGTVSNSTPAEDSVVGSTVPEVGLAAGLAPRSIKPSCGLTGECVSDADDQLLDATSTGQGHPRGVKSGRSEKVHHSRKETGGQNNKDSILSENEKSNKEEEYFRKMKRQSRHLFTERNKGMKRDKKRKKNATESQCHENPRDKKKQLQASGTHRRHNKKKKGFKHHHFHGGRTKIWSSSQLQSKGSNSDSRSRPGWSPAPRITLHMIQCDQLNQPRLHLRTCVYCNCFSTRLAHIMKEHVKVAHPYKCMSCHIPFKEKVEMTAHRLTQHQLEVHHCTLCRQVFLTKYRLDQHMTSKSHCRLAGVQRDAMEAICKAVHRNRRVDDDSFTDTLRTIGYQESALWKPGKKKRRKALPAPGDPPPALPPQCPNLSHLRHFYYDNPELKEVVKKFRNVCESPASSAGVGHTTSSTMSLDDSEEVFYFPISDMEPSDAWTVTTRSAEVSKITSVENCTFTSVEDRNVMDMNLCENLGAAISEWDNQLHLAEESGHKVDTQNEMYPNDSFFEEILNCDSMDWENLPSSVSKDYQVLQPVSGTTNKTDLFTDFLSEASLYPDMTDGSTGFTSSGIESQEDVDSLELTNCYIGECSTEMSQIDKTDSGNAHCSIVTSPFAVKTVCKDSTSMGHERDTGQSVAIDGAALNNNSNKTMSLCSTEASALHSMQHLNVYDNEKDDSHVVCAINECNYHELLPLTLPSCIEMQTKTQSVIKYKEFPDGGSDVNNDGLNCEREEFNPEMHSGNTQRGSQFVTEDNGSGGLIFSPSVPQPLKILSSVPCPANMIVPVPMTLIPATTLISSMWDLDDSEEVKRTGLIGGPESYPEDNPVPMYAPLSVVGSASVDSLMSSVKQSSRTKTMPSPMKILSSVSCTKTSHATLTIHVPLPLEIPSPLPLQIYSAMLDKTENTSVRTVTHMTMPLPLVPSTEIDIPRILSSGHQKGLEKAGFLMHSTRDIISEEVQSSDISEHGGSSLAPRPLTRHHHPTHSSTASWGLSSGEDGSGHYCRSDAVSGGTTDVSGHSLVCRGSGDAPGEEARRASADSGIWEGGDNSVFGVGARGSTESHLQEQMDLLLREIAEGEEALALQGSD